MKTDLAEAPWGNLEKLLRSTQEASGLRREFPDRSVELSILDALGAESFAVGQDQIAAGRHLREELNAILDQLAVFQRINRCPILAITGLLNAGKSSLLATYLSPQNRRRVLRGLDNRSGTHRFVIWLPTIWWNEPELLNTLISYLTRLFGHPPEQLSEDPHEAALQYNGRVLAGALLEFGDDSRELATQRVGAAADTIASLHVPLIASDAALDDLQLGLVDCPDIQTGYLSGGASETRGEELAESRRAQLARLGRLCSAFIAVSRMNHLHDDGLTTVLATLRDVMPGVPRLLAINRVKTRYAPATVYEQARGLVERFGLSGVYVAYDFRSANSAVRIPPRPASMQESEEPLPIFVAVDAVDAAPVDHDPASEQGLQAAPQYLFDLGQRLDSGTLSRASNRSLLLQLKARAAEGLEWLERNQNQRSSQLADSWRAISQACYAFMVQRDAEGSVQGLRLQASPAIIAQMAESLQRTAPLWMRVSLSIDRTARQIQQAVADSAARLKILQSASQTVTQFTRKFRRGEGGAVVTPERLAESIRSYDIHDALAMVSKDHLIAGCEAAIQRFAAEDKTELDRDKLDAWSRQVWKNMSMKQKLWKGTQPLAVLMAPLLAAVLVPIDAGGTAVLVFASTKELLAAAGIAALMAPVATGGGAHAIVQREEPWRQLSDLFAVLCDSLGVPRPDRAQLPRASFEGVERPLLSSNLAFKPTQLPPAVELWTLNAQTRRSLELILQQIP